MDRKEYFLTFWGPEDLEEQLGLIGLVMADVYTACRQWKMATDKEYDIREAISDQYIIQLREVLGVGSAKGGRLSYLGEALEEAKALADDGVIDAGTWSGEAVIVDLYRWFDLKRWRMI